MAWSAPMTATAHTSFPAASFNTYVRDNFLETEPGKAVSDFPNGSIPIKTATNQITYRTPGQAEVTSSQSTSSTSYTNLATPGPTVTATTGTNAIVFWHASMSTTTPFYGYMSFQVTNNGSVTHATADDRALRHSDQNGSAGEGMFGMSFLFTDLTPGANSFQAKYRVSGGTGTFRYRRIGVIPL